MSRLSKGDPSSYSEPGTNSFSCCNFAVWQFSTLKMKNIFYWLEFRINLENVVTKHIDLFWNVDFNKQTISGEAILYFEIVAREIECIVSTLFTQ